MNAANGSSYTYKDVTPLPKAFYRLKVVDNTGAITYSPVFSGGCKDATPFAVYPNPAHKQAVARLFVRESTKASVQLYNITGQLLYTSPWNLQPGLNQFELPVSTLMQRSYAVKVLLNQKILQTLLIKQ